MADVNGNPVHDISSSGYQGSGSGVAVGLGAYAIQPGETATVHVVFSKVGQVLRPDSSDRRYASAVFGNTWFDSQSLTGNTPITVTFHFPVGVKPGEPRWHASPSSWAAQPQTGIDQQGRVTYTWNNPNGTGSQQYLFGASFPAKYVPAEAIPGSSSASPSSFQDACGIVFVVLIMIGGIFLHFFGPLTNQLQYQSPRVSIEGYGIKRGLTAVEAAVMMEEPMDKILTMILFGVIKKNAAAVVERDPLQLSITCPAPEGLNLYEQEFLQAFQRDDRLRREFLRDMMIHLVNSVSMKMKGFSRSETIAYYRDITKRAWDQVEAAQTPDLKSEAYDQNLEWTMIDQDYDRRTQEVFRDGPVFVPLWWGRFDPGYHPVSAGAGIPSVPIPSGHGGTIRLPSLPGATVAASLANTVQSFASGVIGPVDEFRVSVTSFASPEPISTSSARSDGAGRGCACVSCACACAGCACACAGGGR